MPIELKVEKLDSGKTATLVARNMRAAKNYNRLAIVHHPCFFARSSLTETYLSFRYALPAPPSFLHTGLDLGIKLDTEYIPQLMQGIMHAHSRNLILGNVNPCTIVFTSTNAYFIDISGSKLAAGPTVPIDDARNEYHAPETFFEGKLKFKSDYYGLALWWLCGNLRKLVEQWNLSDYMDVHERAMSQATVLQKTMLAFKARDRDNMQSIFERQVEAVNYRGVMNVKQDEWVVAVQKAYEEKGDHFGPLTKLVDHEKFNIYFSDIGWMVAPMMLSVSTNCPDKDSRFLRISRPRIESLLTYLARMLDYSEEWLEKVEEHHCYNLDKLFTVFATIHSERAAKVICAFVKNKTFTSTDSFLMGLLDTSMYPSDLLRIIDVVPPSSVSSILKTVVFKNKDKFEDMQKKLDEANAKLESKTEDAELRLKELSAEMVQLHGYIENIRAMGTHAESILGAASALKSAISAIPEMVEGGIKP